MLRKDVLSLDEMRDLNLRFNSKTNLKDGSYMYIGTSYGNLLLTEAEDWKTKLIDFQSYTYSLKDILDKLPREIKTGTAPGIRYYQKCVFHSDCWPHNWLMGYYLMDSGSVILDSLIIKSSKDLMDVAYQMLVYVLENYPETLNDLNILRTEEETKK